MEKLNLKTIIFALIGIFVYISHITLYREIAADSGYPFFAAVFFSLFLIFWIGIGILLSPFSNKNVPFFIFPLICIAPAGMLGVIAVQLLTNCYPVQSYFALALITFIACFPLGTSFGIMLISASKPAPTQIKRFAIFCGAMGYFLAGFVIYPLGLFNVFTDPVYYTWISCTFIFFLALAVFILKPARSMRYRFLFFSVVIISLMFTLLKLQDNTLHNLLDKRYSGWNLFNTYHTHYGRIYLLNQSQADNKNSSVMIVKNSQIMQTIPDDCELYKTNMVPLTLQPDKKNLKILTVGSSFSYIPTMLSALPYVKEVTLLDPERFYMPMTILHYFSIAPNEKLKIENSNIFSYFEQDSEKYDCIIWLYPKRHYFNFNTLLGMSNKQLRANGVIAVPASLIAANNAQGILESLFKNKITVPGKSRMYAFSNKKLVSDLRVLEKRLDRLDDGERKIFMPGTFSILYSISNQNSVYSETKEEQVISASRLIAQFKSLEVNMRIIITIIGAALIYFVLRFFILRRKSMYVAAGLFENGMSTMMLMAVLMALYANTEGYFYYNFGIILTAICGVPTGMALNNIKLRRLTVILSVIVVFISTLYSWEYYAYFVPCLAYLNFLCAGIIISNIFMQNPEVSKKLLSVHFLACSIGIALVFVLLVMKINLLGIILIIFLFRIPLLFSKMALGKFDIKEALDV